MAALRAELAVRYKSLVEKARSQKSQVGAIPLWLPFLEVRSQQEIIKTYFQSLRIKNVQGFQALNL